MQSSSSTARPLPPLLLLLLLVSVSVLAGVDGCVAPILADAVARSCLSGVPTPACCEPLVASVRLGGGDCLCRVAREMPAVYAGLNVSRVLALYTACGGSRVVTGGNCHGEAVSVTPLAAAGTPEQQPPPRALQPSPAPVPSPSPSVPGPFCESGILAKRITKDCVNPPWTLQCCDAVIAAVDMPACLCPVAEHLVGLTSYSVVTMYHECHGVGPARTDMAAACYDKRDLPAGGSSPPGASSPQGPFRHKLRHRDHKVMIGEMVGMFLEFVVFGTFSFLAIKTCLKGHPKRSEDSVAKHVGTLCFLAIRNSFKGTKSTVQEDSTSPKDVEGRAPSSPKDVQGRAVPLPVTELEDVEGRLMELPRTGQALPLPHHQPEDREEAVKEGNDHEVAEELGHGKVEEGKQEEIQKQARQRGEDEAGASKEQAKTCSV